MHQVEKHSYSTYTQSLAVVICTHDANGLVKSILSILQSAWHTTLKLDNMELHQKETLINKNIGKKL